MSFTLYSWLQNSGWEVSVNCSFLLAKLADMRRLRSAVTAASHGQAVGLTDWWLWGRYLSISPWPVARPLITIIYPDCEVDSVWRAADPCLTWRGRERPGRTPTAPTYPIPSRNVQHTHLTNCTVYKSMKTTLFITGRPFPKNTQNNDRTSDL